MLKMLEVDQSTISIYKVGGGYLLQILLPTGDCLEIPVQEWSQIKQVRDALKFKMLTIRRRENDSV